MCGTGVNRISFRFKNRAKIMSIQSAKDVFEKIYTLTDSWVFNANEEQFSVSCNMADTIIN